MILTDTCIFELYSLLFSPTNSSFAELQKWTNTGKNLIQSTIMSYHAILLIQMMLAHNLVPKE